MTATPGTAECQYCSKGIRKNRQGLWGARKRDDPHPWYCDASPSGKRHEPPAVKPEDMGATAVTRQLITIAEDGGLRPRIESQPEHGRFAVILNGPGRDALFGVIYVGAGTGRVIRAFLTHGNAGEEKQYDTVAGIRAVLKSWAASRCTP